MPEARPPAAAGDLRLPDAVRTVDFISDLHLSPELPRTLAAFEHLLAHTRAGALFILGDLFEVWVGDDMLDQPFEHRCVAALAEAARRLPVHVMRGNRDFLLGDRFFRQSGCQELLDPVTLHAFEQTVLLSHGDALCLGDREYQAFRSQVRTPAWQAAFLAKPLDERLNTAAHMRAASREHQARQDPVTYADVDPALVGLWLSDARSETLIHGHTHRPNTEQRPEGWLRLVLSDWDLDHGSRDRAEVLRWSPQGFTRLSPESV